MKEQTQTSTVAARLARNGDVVGPGYWYVVVDYDPGYTIVSVLKNQFSQAGELMVWMFDEEGSVGADEFTFLSPVPSVARELIDRSI